MEVLLILIAIAIPVIIIAVILTINNKVTDTNIYVRNLHDEVRALRKQLEIQELEAQRKLPVKQVPDRPAETLKPVEVVKQTEIKPFEFKPELPTPVAPKESENIQDRPEVVKHTPVAPPHIERETPVEVKEEKEPPHWLPTGAKLTTPTKQTTPKPAPPPTPKEGWFDRWLRENPDIEKFIGENLVNKIGIAILVLGIGFFVKYAIDQEWIGTIGRVCIGLFCGAGLIGLAHKLRKNYHSFSSVLVGGGLTVFYFTIALAYHEYQLFSQTAAFAIMVVITIFAVLLAVLYNRLELGIIATIGGFVTPFLVSNGQGNYIVLFTYLGILNTGLIVLAYYKRWRLLNFIAFVFTQAIYIGWITAQAGNAGFSYSGTLLFGGIFYAMFLVMNIIHYVSGDSKLQAFDFIILLSVNACFYGAGAYLLQYGGMQGYKGLFTAALAVINLGLAWLFFKQNKADKNFIYLLIGITVTYISLAAPVQLHGNYITMFWAAEAVVLLWLYQRSFIKFFKVASLLITFLMLVSLCMDWGNLYSRISYTNDAGHQAIPIIFNRGCITGIVCGIALLIIYNLLRRHADTYYFKGVTTAAIKSAYITLGITVIFISGVLEIYWQFEHLDELNKSSSITLSYIYLQLYTGAFALILFGILNKCKVGISEGLRYLIPAGVLLVYFINAWAIYNTEKGMLITGTYKIHFISAWLSVALLLLLIYNTVQHTRKTMFENVSSLSLFTWITTLAVIAIISIEMRNLFVWLYYSNPASIDYAENVYAKAGLSIVWGLSSFIIIWVGLKQKVKPLRVIALVVFGITLIKLFAYDIQNIPPAGKIIAFILLGVVLLMVSFMYQRLKKLIIDDKGVEK